MLDALVAASNMVVFVIDTILKIGILMLVAESGLGIIERIGGGR